MKLRMRLRRLAVLVTVGLATSALGQTSPVPGSLDTSFQAAINGTVYAVAVQPPSQVLVGGDFTRVNNQSRNYLARLNANGSLDGSFIYLPGADGPVRSIAVQADGKILLGGDFNSINGASWMRIARLSSDGAVDNSFGLGSGANGRVYVVAAQSDGKVLVGGDFTRVNGVTRNYLARLNVNGSLDTGFNANTAGTVYSMAVQPDGRILIGGFFSLVNNEPHPFLARLNEDGSLDAGFAGSADLTVDSIHLQNDRKAVIGGEFGRVNGVFRSSLARLNIDGTLDTLFNADTSGSVRALSGQADGKLIIAGRFSTVNGVPRNNVARLHANGTLDSSFEIGAGPSYTVFSLALPADGKVLLGGDFTTVNFVDQPYLARLNGDPPLPPGTNVIARIWTAVEIGWNSQTNALYQVQWASEVDTNAWFNLGSPVPGTGSTNSLFDSTRNSPRKFYRVLKLE